MRRNTYDPARGEITVSPERGAAIRRVAAHYVDLFGDVEALEGLREDYAIANDAIPDRPRREQLTAFFQWTAWAATTERPGEEVTYTANWPHEPLVGNTPSTANIVWSIASIVLLIAGIGALSWWHAARKEEAGADAAAGRSARAPGADPPRCGRPPSTSGP